MAFCIWITGMPGSAKTSIVNEFLKNYNGKIELLNMDKLRRGLMPSLKHTEKERDTAYTELVEIAEELVKRGHNVVIDATGHRRKWREFARSRIPNFSEIYIKCPLKICMEREAARTDHPAVSNLYKKALQRLETGEKFEGVDEVIGVDVEYEEPENPELVIETDKNSVEQAATLLNEYVSKL